MVSITSRTLPSGRTTWRVQFRIAGQSHERRFPSREIAREWVHTGGLSELRDARVRAQQPSAVVVEEFEFFLAMGEATHRICEALRMSPGAVQRALYRAGRLDLARRIEAT